MLSCVDVPRPGEMLVPGGVLSGKGWAISEAEIESIAVHLGERFLCYASYGQHRPEIGRDFAHYRQAHHSGFVFSVQLDADIVRERGADLQFRFRTGTGTESRRVVRLSWPAADAGPDVDEDAARPWPIRLALDECRVDASLRLRLRGWAVAREALTSLTLFLDETRLPAPERGLPRPDIARRHGGYGAAGASGFLLIHQLEAPLERDGFVRVVARSGGLQRQIIVPLAAAVAGPRVLRAGEVTLGCDALRLSRTGMLLVAGWAVGGAATRTIELLDAAGTSLGLAETGLARPDIGNRFPRLPDARHGGFRFHGRTGLARGSRIVLLVRDDAGGERRMELVLPGGAEADEAAAEAIHAGIDTPKLADGVAIAAVRGIVTVAGWAACASGVERVQVWCDDSDLGCATLGGRREDVAGLFPEIAGALTAGFTLTVPHRLIGAGTHAMRVVIHARAGASAEQSFRMELEPDDDRSVGVIRRAVPFAETRLRRELLQRHGAMPQVTVVIKPGGSEMRGVAATLDALRRQSLASWQAIVLQTTEGAGNDAIPDVEGLAERVRLHAPGDASGLWPAAARSGFDLLCVLRAGDLLGADALMELAVEMRLAGADFAYADERCHDPGRGGAYPFLKPDWSPRLLTSVNYVGRAWCATRALCRRARVGLETIEHGGDYEVVLRLTEQAARVAHVPAVLFERAGRRAEPAAREQAALERMVARRGLDATVVADGAFGGTGGHWRVEPVLAGPGGGLPLVSVIIATCGARGLIRGAVDGLRRSGWPLEIICLDDIPADQPALKSWLRTAADRVIPVAGAFNWSRLNNVGAAAASGDLLLFLNDDIEMPAAALAGGWLAAMVAEVLRPGVGAVGPRLLYPDGKVQHAGMLLRDGEGVHLFRFAGADDPGAFGLALSTREVSAVTGACLLTRRAVFDAAGGFDESHSVIKNDLDYCLRLGRDDLRVIYTPAATLIHHEMASRAHLPDSHDAARFDGTWRQTGLRGDPYGNPQLSERSEDWLAEAEPVQLLQPGGPMLEAAAVRRILVVKLDHIGDFVCALPALMRLRAAFPASAITLLAAPATLALARLCPAIDHVVAFRFFADRPADGARAVGAEEYEALGAALRPLHFDLAIDLRLHADTRHVLRHVGAARVAGFDHHHRFPWLDIAREWEGDPRLADKRAHVSDTLLGLADAVANAAATPPAARRVPPAQAAAVRARLLAEAPDGFAERRLVGIHPGAGTALKQWPVASFAGLITLLLADHALSIVLIGGPDEAGIAQELAGLVGRPDAVLVLAGHVALAELPALLQGCALFVGNDSGPKHLAAALGVPTLGIHASHVDAAEWGPAGARAIALRRHMSCGPCYIQQESECPREVACLRGISAAQAYRACRLLLGLGGGPSSAASAARAERGSAASGPAATGAGSRSGARSRRRGAGSAG